VLLGLLSGLSILPAPGGESEAQAAPAASAYDHGNIISDTVFRDFGTMSVSQIQAFFKSKVSSCSSAPAARKCLTEYRGDTQSKGASANGCTKAMPKKKNITAAQMVYDVAVACQINPQVLIVLMQKEQGLVTTKNPTDWQINQATGWGCPDNGSCRENNGGLFHSLYAAAWQFNQYFKDTSFFSWYPVGKVSSIKEHPKSGTSNNPNKCTTKSVTIKNKATAALYYYTPYYPNSAALKNMYGEGNKCSSYGNRNFWRYFHDWFGSTQGGTYLAKTKDAATVYLLVDSDRYRISGTDTATQTALKSVFGKVGTVSSTYINSFTDRGVMRSPVIYDRQGWPYLIDKGLRSRFSGGCEEAEAYGWSCAVVPQLTAEQISPIKTTNVVNPYFQRPDGTRYLLQDGKRRQIVDLDAVAESGITLPELLVQRSAVYAETIPAGAPILANGTLVKRPDSTVEYVYADGAFYGVSNAMRRQLDARLWFGNPTVTLTDAVITEVGKKTMPGMFRVAGTDDAYLLERSGAVRLNQPEQWNSALPELPASLVDLIPKRDGQRSAPRFIKDTSNSQVYLVFDGAKRPVTAAQRQQAAKELGIANTVSKYADAVVAAIPKVNFYQNIGQVLQSTNDGSWWLVTDFGIKRPISKSDAQTLFGTKVTAKNAGNATLNAHRTLNEAVPTWGTCSGYPWVAYNGKRYKVDPAYMDRYEAVISFEAFNTALCKKLPLNSADYRMRGIVQINGVQYELVEGVLVPLTPEEYQQRRLELGNARNIPGSLAAILPVVEEAPVAAE